MRALGGATATLALFRLTTLRFVRSRVLWVAALFAFLPLLPFAFSAGAGDDPHTRWADYFEVISYVHMLVAALLMAPVVAEEIEEKTYTYLWSRPIPRWSVLAGKLMSGATLAGLILTASALAATAVTGLADSALLLQGIAALLLGALCVGCVSASLGIFMPKHSLAISITYFLLLDSMVGAMPFAGARMSVMHNVLAISGHGPDKNSFAVSLAWLGGVAVFWTLLAIWNLGRKELSTGS